MRASSAGALTIVDQTLLVQLNAALTDASVRQLRDDVGSTLSAQALRGVVLDLSAVDFMDSYITHCIRNLAVSAKLMGVPTVVCGVRPSVADTLVEMGLTLGDVRTALNLDGALRVLRGTRRPTRRSEA
jgi:rsbT antagonist protein RsbS